MSDSATKLPLPLFVDLDGTLIKSDLTLESLLALIKQNIFYLLIIPLWLVRGRAFLKAQLAQRTRIAVEQLPLNREFLAFLEVEKSRGRAMTLISASNQQQVSQVSQHLGLFDSAIGSDDKVNLKAGNKLKRIRQLVGDHGFSYAGNSRADLPIWAEAEQVIMVNCGIKLGSDLADDKHPILSFDQPGSTFAALLRAMRPHQWLKNGLLLLPLILAHQLNQWQLLLQAGIGFVSFSLCASSVYLLNDMLDLGSDRAHRQKHKRPFACGELSLTLGIVSMLCLLVGAFLVALALPWQFLTVLLGYWLLTFLYSIYLKRLFLLDVISLALLYTIRIIAGAAAIAVVTTPYLIAFSLSLFLGLAMVKRVTELTNAMADGLTGINGRAYSSEHMKILSKVGGAASLIAVAVFALYISDPATAQLYSSPYILWSICPLLLYLLIRIWGYAHAGKLEEDPVLFAITDHLSQGIVVLAGILIWLAT
jgi:4-hydroxybenzoate polyprenyltransferase/phosphoserine phosphatase